MEPDRDVVLRTFALESIRSVAVGIQETAYVTFAILIALKEFDSGPAAKSILLASQAVGLIGSLFVVPAVKRLSLRLNRAASGIGLFGVIGFGAAAVLHESEAGFIAGLSAGFLFMALPLPLQTQILRQNYPSLRRGRMFSITMVIRAISTMGFSYLGGLWLDRDFGNFTTLLLIFAGAALLSTICFWLIPGPAAVPDRPRPARGSVFQSMRWLRLDPVFRSVILAGIFMGLGFLPAMALRVDYLANEKHGVMLDVATISLVSGVLPSISRILSSFFWGWLFDRMNFFWLRLIVNAVFVCGVVCYFSTPLLGFIVAGSILYGLGRGGGEILWNLWVTKVARSEHVAEYMSVHTFLTGLRALLAPFLGFYVAEIFSARVLMAVSVCLISLSAVFLVPLLGSKTAADEEG